MRIPIYQIDAFTDRQFAGNPAAVCPLPAWIPDETMQRIAEENNLSETAFFVPEGSGYRIRWFTPAAEIDLCGHATLASAFVVFTYLEPGTERVVFLSRSGDLAVELRDGLLALDFPSRPARPVASPAGLAEALGAPPLSFLLARDFMAVYATEGEVAALRPDPDALLRLKIHSLIATAPGEQVDFVSRFFAPGMGIPEDPVTGSSHCTLVPYWSDRLGKKSLQARQISRRGGELACENLDGRVRIAGRAVRYLEGTIHVEDV